MGLVSTLLSQLLFLLVSLFLLFLLFCCCSCCFCCSCYLCCICCSCSCCSCYICCICCCCCCFPLTLLPLCSPGSLSPGPTADHQHCQDTAADTEHRYKNRGTSDYVVCVLAAVLRVSVSDTRGGEGGSDTVNPDSLGPVRPQASR